MQTGAWTCVTLCLKWIDAGIYDVSWLSYSRLQVTGYHYTDIHLLLAFLIFVAMVTTEQGIFWILGYSDNQQPTWAVHNGVISETKHLPRSLNLVDIKYTSDNV
jgi:hypothetical protein